jgi:hypothetical protein
MTRDDSWLHPPKQRTVHATKGLGRLHLVSACLPRNDEYAETFIFTRSVFSYGTLVLLLMRSTVWVNLMS